MLAKMKRSRSGDGPRYQKLCSSPTSCASARSVSARDTGLTSRVKGVHTNCADQFCGCCGSVWRVALPTFVEPMNAVGIANSELLIFLYGYSVFYVYALFVSGKLKTETANVPRLLTNTIY